MEDFKFHQHKSPILIDDINQYFIGYKENKKVRPLWIILPKLIAYRRDFDETKYIPFLVKDIIKI